MSLVDWMGSLSVWQWLGIVYVCAAAVTFAHVAEHVNARPTFLRDIGYRLPDRRLPLAWFVTVFGLAWLWPTIPLLRGFLWVLDRSANPNAVIVSQRIRTWANGMPFVAPFPLPQDDTTENKEY
jgi:Ca2+/Na+ antiporter